MIKSVLFIHPAQSLTTAHKQNKNFLSKSLLVLMRIMFRHDLYNKILKNKFLKFNILVIFLIAFIIYQSSYKLVKYE